MNDVNIIDAVDRSISELLNFDLVLTDEPKEAPTSTYVQRHRHEYIRTVRDIARTVPVGGSVLEIGSFFGVVCMALKTLGYEVTASDMPEYINMPAQVERYARHGIHRAEVRLEDFLLPFADETFDAVIMCEVLEHLNFNPIPLLKEINRIGKPKSIFYLSLPNLASIYNRNRFIGGRAVGVQVEDFFEQLDPKSSAIANGHWREYTAPEVRKILEPLGFTIAEQYYFSFGETQPSRTLRKKLARRFFETFPALKENQTTIAIRDQRTATAFRIPATVHRTLRTI